MNYLAYCSLLYLEDNDDIRENMGRVFAAFCKSVTTVKTYEDAILALEKEKYSIAVCDIELEGDATGIDFIRRIRETNKETQIIVLSAKRDERFLLEAIPLNLVEYLIKPVSFEEIEESLNSCAARLEEIGFFRFKLCKNTFFAPQEGAIYKNGEKVILREKESALLSLLVKKNGKLLQKDEIEAKIYDYEATDGAIKSLFNKLRKKIGEDAIESIPSLGYRLSLK